MRHVFNHQQILRVYHSLVYLDYLLVDFFATSLPHLLDQDLRFSKILAPTRISIWAVSVCKLQKGIDKWKLVKIKKDSPIQHECLGEKTLALEVSDYKIQDNDHWSFLLKDNVNTAVEIQNES